MIRVLFPGFDLVFLLCRWIYIMMRIRVCRVWVWWFKKAQGYTYIYIYISAGPSLRGTTAAEIGCNCLSAVAVVRTIAY